MYCKAKPVVMFIWTPDSCSRPHPKTITLYDLIKLDEPAAKQNVKRATETQVM